MAPHPGGLSDIDNNGSYIKLQINQRDFDKHVCVILTAKPISIVCAYEIRGVVKTNYHSAQT